LANKELKKFIGGNKKLKRRGLVTRVGLEDKGWVGVSVLPFAWVMF
jgi:hypothetical protein